jgi:hypothetical protein
MKRLLRVLTIGTMCFPFVAPVNVLARQSGDGSLANELARMKGIIAEQERRISVLEQAIGVLREESLRAERRPIQLVCDRVRPQACLGRSVPTGIEFWSECPRTR